MNYYELIKEYGKGKGEDKMWQSTRLISDYIKPMKEKDPDGYWKLIKDTYAIMNGMHYNEKFADWQISEMWFKDKKGEVHHAPRWNKDQYKVVYDANKSKLKNSAYNMWDFAVTLEMIASDNYCMMKEWFPNAMEADLDAKFVEMAINWLNDEDYPDGKIWEYFNK